jgi:hypothetical protein
MKQINALINSNEIVSLIVKDLQYLLNISYKILILETSVNNYAKRIR